MFNREFQLFIQCDTSLILRAFSIYAIVSNHFGLYSLIGGSLFLIALSGFNFVKFTLIKFNPIPGYPEKLLFSDFFTVYYRFVGKLILPTCLYLLFIYTALGKFHVSGLLLASNFFGPDHADGLSYWFLEVLVQIYILFSLIFVIPPLRQSIAKNPYTFFFYLSLFSYLAARLCIYVFDTEHLLNRLPHLLFYIFVMGALVACSHTYKQKVLSSVLITIICAEEVLKATNTLVTFLYISLLTTLWIKHISIPKFIYPPVKAIALSSLFIYLSHFQTHRLIEKVFGEIHPAFSVVSALIVGVIMSEFWKRRANFLGYIRKAISGPAREKVGS